MSARSSALLTEMADHEILSTFIERERSKSLETNFNSKTWIVK